MLHFWLWGGAPAKPAWRRLAAAEMHYVETCVSLEILKIHLSLKMCYFAIGHTRAHEEAHAYYARSQLT